MLVIEVEYLLGRAYAAQFRDNSKPEWPPHPSRLFSALVAAYHDSNGSEEERDALLWLEKQDPPVVLAGKPGEPVPVGNFVPTNYGNKAGNTHPEYRTRQPRSFAVQSPASPIARFLWNGDLPEKNQATALAGLAERVTSLGRACCLVRARVIEEPGLEHELESYVPDGEGQTVLGVAYEGRLEELERTFADGRRPSQAAPVRYRKENSEPAREMEVRGHFGEMIVLRRTTGIGFPITSTPALTKALRKAFLSQAGNGSELNAVLSGHKGDGPAQEPHVAFVALPNVERNFGDGRLVGLGVVLPVSISKADRRLALRACANIDSLNLEGFGEWKVEIANFDVRQKTLKVDTWIGASRRWASTTPILLDRFPKKQLSPEELIVAACVRAGLPVPATIKLGPYPTSDEEMKGRAPVFAYETKRYALHATLTFNQKVRGPILIGAGRFFGMGLMRPLSGRGME